MATTATLTGTFSLPNDAAPDSAVLSVTLSAMDTDQNTRHVLPDDGSFTVALVAGAIPAGQEIWKNTAGLRGTHYRATLAWTASDGRLLSRYLGSFQVGDDASYDMADLLDQPPIASLPEGWYSTLTQGDYDAAITARDQAVAAAAAAAEDAIETAADRAAIEAQAASYVTLTGTQTLTNKTINLASNTLVATSAQLRAALTDETGTGAAVFAGSPALTGTPTAPTAAQGTNTTQVATTEFVVSELDTATTEIDAAIIAATAAAKVDTTAGLAGITPGMLPVGGLIRVIETGDVWRRVASGGDLDYSGTGGVMFDLHIRGSAPFATVEDLLASGVDLSKFDLVAADAGGYAVIGADLAAGSFATDLTGWTSLGTASWVSAGVAQATAAGGVFPGRLRRAFTGLTVGATYAARCRVEAVSGGATVGQIYVSTSVNAGDAVAQAAIKPGVYRTIEFVATAATMYLLLDTLSAAIGATVQFAAPIVRRTLPGAPVRAAHVTTAAAAPLAPPAARTSSTPLTSGPAASITS